MLYIRSTYLQCPSNFFIYEATTPRNSSSSCYFLQNSLIYSVQVVPVNFPTPGSSESSPCSAQPDPWNSSGGNSYWCNRRGLQVTEARSERIRPEAQSSVQLFCHYSQFRMCMHKVTHHWWSLPLGSDNPSSSVCCRVAGDQSKAVVMDSGLCAYLQHFIDAS